jgi:thiol peroxidase
MTLLIIGLLGGLIVGAGGAAFFSRHLGRETVIRSTLAGAISGLVLGGLVGWQMDRQRDMRAAAAGVDFPEVESREQLRNAVREADRPTLVYIYSPSCSICAEIAPRLTRAREQFGDRLNYVKINASLFPDFARSLNIPGTPTVILYRPDGEEIGRFSGAKEYDDIRSLIERGPHRPAGSDTAPTPQPEETSMTDDRTVTMKGQTQSLVGRTPQPGEKAPDATLVANDLSTVELKDYIREGRILVISAVPSLDTPVCDTQTRRFNEEAARLRKDVDILTVSMDLPFAQKRWCAAADVEHVRTLSDYREAEFGRAYGVLIEEQRLLARSVFIVDGEGVIRYVQIVPEISRQPDYDDVLRAIAELQT